uniref:Uncharacterized protein n=1 Tax=Sus scrofa TaxID=9823 RepID=A0A5G2Q922_PIG
MKLRFPSRYLPNFTNPNRPIPSNTLYIRYNNSLLISNTYLSRRKLWMNYSLPTCKWSINILHLPIHPCRPRPILRILCISRNMKHQSNSIIYCYSNSLHGLRPTLRTNIILRSYCHHKPTISYSLYWNKPCRMNLRRFLRRQSNPYTILRLPLHSALHHRCPRSCTSFIPTRNWIQ